LVRYDAKCLSRIFTRHELYQTSESLLVQALNKLQVQETLGGISVRSASKFRDGLFQLRNGNALLGMKGNVAGKEQSNNEQQATFHLLPRLRAM